MKRLPLHPDWLRTRMLCGINSGVLLAFGQNLNSHNNTLKCTAHSWDSDNQSKMCQGLESLPVTCLERYGAFIYALCIIIIIVECPHWWDIQKAIASIAIGNSCMCRYKYKQWQLYTVLFKMQIFKLKSTKISFLIFYRVKEMKARLGSFLQKQELNLMGLSNKTDKLRTDDMLKSFQNLLAHKGQSQTWRQRCRFTDYGVNAVLCVIPWFLTKLNVTFLCCI